MTAWKDRVCVRGEGGGAGLQLALEVHLTLAGSRSLGPPCWAPDVFPLRGAVVSLI